MLHEFEHLCAVFDVLGVGVAVGQEQCAETLLLGPVAIDKFGEHGLVHQTLHMLLEHLVFEAPYLIQLGGQAFDGFQVVRGLNIQGLAQGRFEPLNQFVIEEDLF